MNATASDSPRSGGEKKKVSNISYASSTLTLLLNAKLQVNLIPLSLYPKASSF